MPWTKCAPSLADRASESGRHQEAGTQAISERSLRERDAEGGEVCYLLGTIYAKTPWYYYLVVFLIKEPLIVIVLVLLGSVLLFRRESSVSGMARMVLFTPPAVFILAFSMGTNIGIGIRYLIPVFPFLYLIPAAGISSIPERASKAVLFYV